MTIQIRRIRSEEWWELRSLRLRALAEVPTAYGSTLAEEQTYSDEVWHERALGTSNGCDRATFIAERKGNWLGMVTGLLDRDGRGRLLVAMFVTSAVRRQGLGLGLVEAIVLWARNCGANQIALWVNSENNPAIAFYKQCGFRFTGGTQPLAHIPELTEQEMVRQL
jgi:GNAT superfamily N-acetyltransferase